MARLPILDRLEEELKALERELKVEIPKELRKAAAHGDLRENAEYAAAKERQSFLQARIAQLRKRIESLSSIHLESIPRDRVAFGARVKVMDLDSGEERVYELVSPEDVDPKEGKISVSSPIGRGLMGRGVGEEVTIQLPAGRKEFEILEITPIHEILGDSEET